MAEKESSPTVPARRQAVSVPINMHPTRMQAIAEQLSRKADASDDVRLLASLVTALCFQVNQARSEASRAVTVSRRIIG